MKTAFKPMLLHFLRSWILYAGVVQIMNSVCFIITAHVLIDGPVWQIVVPAIMVSFSAWIPRYNRWLDSKFPKVKNGAQASES